MKAFLKSAMAVVMIFVIAITMFGPELDFSKPSKDNNSTGNITINGSNGGVIGGVIVDGNGNIIYYPTTNGGFSEDIFVEAPMEGVDEDRYISELKNYASYNQREFNILFSGGSADSDVVFGELGDRSIMHASRENFHNASYELNLSLGMTTVAKANYISEVRKLVDSGSDEYDIVVPSTKDAVTLAMSGYLYNLNDTYPLFAFNENEDVSWWNESLIDECTIGDYHTYFVTGPLSAGYVCDLSTIVFNRDLFMELGFNPDQVETLVEKGMWTVDTLYQYANSIYSDHNGNGIKDSEDLIGFVIDVGDIETLRVGAGVSYITKEGSEYQVGNIQGNIGIELCDFLYNMFNYSQGAAVLADGGYYSSNSVFEGSVENSMVDWRSVFTMSTVGSIIEKELYGFTVLPLPKYDEKKDYITPYSASGAVYAIPTSARDAGVSAAYLEILAIKSVSGNSEIVSRLVKEYMHNGNSSRMLSFVMNNPVIEYEPYLVSECAPDFTTIVYNAVVNGNNNVTTTIRKSIKVVSEYLTKLNKTY